MKLLGLIEKMIQNYRQMFGQFPDKIIIGTGAKRQLEQELFEYQMNNPVLRKQQTLFLDKKQEIRDDLTYMGVSINFDSNEKFVRLESKK